MRTPGTPEFEEWLKSPNSYLQGLVEARLLRIRESEAFGNVRYLGDRLYELKWKNGLRVYFGYVTDSAGKAALMLLGGSKNGQARDIAKARHIFRRYAA